MSAAEGNVWGVEVSSRAARDIGRLPPRVAPAVVEFVTRVLPQNPERLSKPLTGEFEGLRSARRGDYRVIFELDQSELIILVIRVAHRAHVYRPD